MKRADRALREAGRSALVERANVRIDIVADKAKGLLHRQTSLDVQGPTSADAQSEPITCSKCSKYRGCRGGVFVWRGYGRSKVQKLRPATRGAFE